MTGCGTARASCSTLWLFFDNVAATRIMPLHTGAGRTLRAALRKIFDYAEDPGKTDNGSLISTYRCNREIIDGEFAFSKRKYEERTGLTHDGDNDVIAYQVRQAFRPGEITPEEANRLGVEFARRFTRGDHAFIVCTHIDRRHIHNHIIWNSTTLDCTRKFRDFHGSGRAVRRLSDTICIENGYSVIENPQGRGMAYNKWLGNSKKPCHRDDLRAAIDRALEKDPADLDALFDLLRKGGIQVSRRGKSVNLKAPGWAKAARLSSLGPGYTEDDLMAVLAGKKKHTPREKTAAQADPPKVNLLVDIQAKLAEGKGAGYARWAASFNLKQMANTLNYLTENKLLDYGALCEKTDAATARFHDLSGKIKAAEARMSEIAELKTQIINYSKTREVYAAYRKAGYSKKFLAEHEREILLHKAAKKAFDELGLKKLPTVKSLQAEYAKLLAEKKRAYSEYRAARDEMQNLQMARANVARIMGYDDKTPTRKKQRKTPSHDVR